MSPQIFNLLIIAVKTCGFLFHPRSFTSLFLVIFIFMFKLFQIWSVGASLSWLLSFDGSRCFCSHPISGTMRCHLVLFFSKPGICCVSKGPLSSYHGGWSWFTKIWALSVLSWMGGVTACIAQGTKWEVTSVIFLLGLSFEMSHFRWGLVPDETSVLSWLREVSGCRPIRDGRGPPTCSIFMGPSSVRPG